VKSSENNCVRSNRGNRIWSPCYFSCSANKQLVCIHIKSLSCFAWQVGACARQTTPPKPDTYLLYIRFRRWQNELQNTRRLNMTHKTTTCACERQLTWSHALRPPSKLIFEKAICSRRLAWEQNTAQAHHTCTPKHTYTCARQHKRLYTHERLSCNIHKQTHTCIHKHKHTRSVS